MEQFKEKNFKREKSIDKNFGYIVSKHVVFNLKLFLGRKFEYKTLKVL
jgi:hypothetical protein